MKLTKRAMKYMGIKGSNYPKEVSSAMKEFLDGYQAITKAEMEAKHALSTLKLTVIEVLEENEQEDKADKFSDEFEDIKNQWDDKKYVNATMDMQRLVEYMFENY